MYFLNYSFLLIYIYFSLSSCICYNRGIRADFLENEAELSGSEEDSGDEYEGGHDFMEEEEGDQEQFDENDLRNQVRNSYHFSIGHILED